MRIASDTKSLVHLSVCVRANLSLLVSVTLVSVCELDVVILAQLLACTNQSPGVVAAARNLAAELQKSYTTLIHQSKSVCAKMFGMLHGIGRTRFKNLLKSLKENGLTS